MVFAHERQFTKKITSCKGLDYWQRLKHLQILSLQRRRGRFIIIHIWKIYHEIAPNDIGMTFYSNDRLGLKVRVPPFNHRAQTSISSAYESSFAVNGARLWIVLPKEVNLQPTLDGLKASLGKFINKYPDQPPIPGYTTSQNNSLLSWRAVGRVEGERA